MTHSVISHFTVFVCFSNRASREGSSFSYSTAFRNSRIFSPKCDTSVQKMLEVPATKMLAPQERSVAPCSFVMFPSTSKMMSSGASPAEISAAFPPCAAYSAQFSVRQSRIHHQKIDAVDIIKHFLDLPDRCRRVDREEPLAAVRHEVIERALHLESALIMNRHDVLFVNADPRQLVLRVFNHQMKIERNTRQFPQSADVVDAKAEVRNELARPSHRYGDIRLFLFQIHRSSPADPQGLSTSWMPISDFFSYFYSHETITLQYGSL